MQAIEDGWNRSAELRATRSTPSATMQAMNWNELNEENDVDDQGAAYRATLGR